MAGSKSTRADGPEFAAGDRFNGLSAKQLGMVLEQIALSAGVLAEFSRDAGQRANLSVQNDFHVIQHMAERLGALAELPIDDPIVHGPFEEWVLGRRYAETDEAMDATEAGA